MCVIAVFFTSLLVSARDEALHELQRSSRERAEEMISSMAKIKLAQESAELASAQKSKFIAFVSHEIRNPIHVITNMTDSLFSVLDDAMNALTDGVTEASSAPVRACRLVKQRQMSDVVSPPRWRPTTVAHNPMQKERFRETGPDRSESSASHPFPLSAATKLSSSISSRASFIEEFHHCLKALDSSTKYLLSLVNDILNLGRLESGVTQLEIRPVRLIEELERTSFVLLAESAKSLGIVFELNVEDDVPKVLMVDMLRLQQIINNLVSNALKFTPQGGKVALRMSARPAENGSTSASPTLQAADPAEKGKTPIFAPPPLLSALPSAQAHSAATHPTSELILLETIKIESTSVEEPIPTPQTSSPSSPSATPHGSPSTSTLTTLSCPSPLFVELFITVSDTGIGIPAATLPELFKPYTQATASTARKFGGSGLGLCITSMLVNAMEGRIWVESEEGRGTTFTVAVPLRVVEEMETNLDSFFLVPNLPPVPDSVALLSEFPSDEPINRKIMVRMLRKLLGPSATIYEAADGTEAVDLCARLISSHPSSIDNTTVTEMLKSSTPTQKTERGDALAMGTAAVVAAPESGIKNESSLSTSSLVVGQGLVHTDAPRTPPSVSALAPAEVTAPKSGIKNESPLSTTSSLVVGQGLIHTDAPRTPSSQSTLHTAPKSGIKNESPLSATSLV
ncbi:hypothetical protein HK102_004965, partial [Quaeritorhiza haematococci]